MFLVSHIFLYLDLLFTHGYHTVIVAVHLNHLMLNNNSILVGVSIFWQELSSFNGLSHRLSLICVFRGPLNNGRSTFLKLQRKGRKKGSQPPLDNNFTTASCQLTTLQVANYKYKFRIIINESSMWSSISFG